MDSNRSNKKFSPEVRERAVRMVLDHQGEYASQWAAMVSIGAKMAGVLLSLADNFETSTLFGNLTVVCVGIYQPERQHIFDLHIERGGRPPTAYTAGRDVVVRRAISRKTSHS
jgi:hypothetical protein